jgi:hypothetical protein
MSRQAGPSIVLSVLIVCFFAVALFERDLSCPQPRQARSSVRGSGARWSVPPALGRARSEQREGFKRTSRGVIQGKTPAPSQGRSTSRNRDHLASASRNPRVPNFGSGRSEKPHGLRSDLPSGRLRQASVQASGQEQPTSTSALSASQKLASTRGPQSAFTIALPAETIEDVSSRVYGTVDLADSLWRANRDTLPKRDSSLTSGMLLRTPNIR